MAAIFLVYQAPIGVDVQFHLKIAEVWARGEDGMFAKIALDTNKIPYPPLLHWILVPAVLLNSEILYAAVLQIFFLPLAVASSMFLVWKHYGRQAAMLEGLLLLGSFAFVDRAMQVNPQALDLMLLPLAFYTFLKKDRDGCVIVSLLMILNHGIVGLAAIGGMLLLQLHRKDYKTLLYFSLSSLSILGSQLWYLPQALARMSSGFETLQEAQFWNNPVVFTVLYQRLITVGFLIGLILTLYHFDKHKPLDDMTKLSLATIGTLAIMLPFWADRFVQYSTIPLSLLIIGQVVRSKPRQKELWQYGILLCFIAFYAAMWLWLFVGLYQI